MYVVRWVAATMVFATASLGAYAIYRHAYAAAGRTSGQKQQSSAATAPAGAQGLIATVPHPNGSSSFFAALRACMQQLGGRCDYDYLLGGSGAAFRRAFRVDAPGDDLLLFGREPVRRACWMLAIEYRWVPSRPDEMAQAIRAAIDDGRPVIGFGLAGSPHASVIAGYQGNGAVLLGYGPQHDPDGPVAQWQNWAEGMRTWPNAGLLLPGIHAGRFPPEREILATALKYAVDLEKTASRPEPKEYVCGLEAMKAWATMLETDSLFPPDNPEQLKLHAMVHASQVAMLRERSGAAYFLRQASASTPEAMEPLSLAANCFDEAASHATNLLRDDLPTALASRDTRLLFAQEVRAAYAAEAKAVAELERALAIPPQLPQRAQIRTPTPSEMTRGAKWQVEANAIPIAFRAAMDVVGEDFGRSVRDGWSTNDAYTLFAGVCGDAFLGGINITADGQRHDIFRRVTAAERETAYRRALEAAGYSGEVLIRPEDGKAASAFTLEALKQRISQAISTDACPVIVHGLAGPEQYTVVTGYEQGGAALYGWSCAGKSSSILFEPEKLEKLRDWFAHADSVVVIGQRQQRDDRAVYVRALERGLELLQRREDGGYCAGPALYEAWAKPFDRDYPIGTAGVKEIQDLINPAIWDLAERRHTAQRFVEMAAKALPDARAELLSAGDEFRAIHDLMWKINEVAGEGYVKVADAPVRVQIAKLIREAQQHDANACRQIQAAIGRLNPQAR